MSNKHLSNPLDWIWFLNQIYMYNYHHYYPHTQWEISLINANCKGWERLTEVLAMFLFVYVNDTYVSEQM